MSKHVPIGLIETPFHPRLEPLSRAKKWMNWAGYISAGVMDTLEFEYFAIRNQTTLFDISPMHKYRIKGKDALLVVNRLVTRDIGKIRDGRVSYVLWCDEDGNLIDDGTLFRYSAQDFRLCCQESMLTWLIDTAWGFEVTIKDESHNVAALSLQGPTSYSLLSDAGISVGDMKPFDWCEVEPGLWISRTGFTGDLGYELWTSNDQALALWDRLWGAGHHWGLRAIGFEALNICRIDAGFMAAGFDFQPVHHAVRLGRGRSPIALGASKMIDFKKGHFNGRRALLTEAQTGPSHHLRKIDIGGFKPADGALIYYKKKHEVGHVTSGVWSPTTKRNIALAEFKAPYGDTIKNDLWAEIYINKEGQWDKRLVRVEIENKPFFQNARSRATPPKPF
ncbi:MAG: aminomethyltransferase family protein [Paracoccaceae bacterium]|nr:aminomethyltransferase family protein [Paracoccaceae bacterium]